MKDESIVIEMTAKQLDYFMESISKFRLCFNSNKENSLSIGIGEKNDKGCYEKNFSMNMLKDDKKWKLEFIVK